MNLLEVCCADLASVRAAAEGGAHRIELCIALELDGLTPSADMIRAARAVCDATAAQRGGEAMRLHVLIRPREGDFVYAADEVQQMVASIRLARELGADGVVIGALTPDGDIDVEACRAMMHEAAGMQVTFHRAFDVCRQPLTALEQIIALGCHRLLTSGQAPTAAAGLPLLRQLVAQAGSRLIVMPGAGVGPDNAAGILQESGAREIHGSCRAKASLQSPQGGSTDAAVVRTVVQAIARVC